MEVVGQSCQSCSLTRVQGLVTLGVVAHQNLTKRRLESLDVFGEILAVLKIELFLSAFFGRARGCIAVHPRVMKDGCSELLVHQDAGLLLRYAGFEGRSEAVVDDLFGGGDL